MTVRAPQGWLVDECSTSLLTQIQNNARKIGSEAAAVFEAEIAVGAAIASTMAKGVAEAWSPLNGLTVGTIENGSAHPAPRFSSTPSLPAVI